MNKRRLGATVAIVGVAAAFALRGGHITKVVPPPIAAQQETPGAALAPVKTAGARVAAAAPAASWKERYESADDDLSAVKAALPAAQAGDGRAAYSIAQTLHSCADVISRYHDSADPEAQLREEIVELQRGTPGVRKHPLPQWVLDDREHNTRRCLRLAKEGVPGGHDGDYWYAKALVAGDPLALEDEARDAAANIVADPLMSADVKAAKLKVIQDNLRAVVESGDPDALFQAGQMLSGSPHLTTDTLQGIAVQLAACDLGANCPKTDSQSGCVMMGTCPVGADFAYYMQQSLGQEGYAQVYARAQQVVQLERAGDYQGVLAYLTIDKHP